MQHKSGDMKLTRYTAGTYPSHDHALHPRETKKQSVLSACSDSKPHTALSLMV